MKITFIRHCETEGNVKGVIQGQSDSPLTLAGRRQCARLGEFLHGVQLDDPHEFCCFPLDPSADADDWTLFSRVFCSDLHRTKETLALLNLDPEIPCVYDQLLRERKAGVDFEGKPKDLRKRTMEAVWSSDGELRNKYGSIGEYERFYKEEGGESWEDVQSRVRLFLKSTIIPIVHKQEDHHLLVVSHGGWIKELVNLLEKRSNTPNACRYTGMWTLSIVPKTGGASESQVTELESLTWKWEHQNLVPK
eukprot:ANDGO_00886.mRNA.1 putative phosphatase C1687.21